jgi:DNA gyrase subunit B
VTLARKYVRPVNVIERLSNWMDVRGPARLANGLTLNLDTPDAEASAAAAQGCAARRRGDRRDRPAHRQAPPAHQPHAPRQRQVPGHHADFVHGADYELLSRAGLTFKGLLQAGRRGAPRRGREGQGSKVTDFRAAMAWLMQQAEGSVGRQRYKGLGEMNPAQLWETTMDPTVRRLLRVQIEDAIEADRVFTMLMGDEVEPRREFIEANALRAANIDACRESKKDHLDKLIAAHAVAADVTLVTNNTRDFARYPGLRVENWLDEAG